MKILIVIIRWEGGVGSMVKNQKIQFEKLGHQVEIISREDDLKCFSTKDAFFKIRKEVKSRDYDILFTQDWSSALPFILFKNHYVQFNGIEIKSSFCQKAISRIKKRNLIVIGDKLKEKYPKATLAYTGLNLDSFRDLKMKRIPNTIGFANFEWDDYNYKEIKEAVDNLGLKLIKTNMNLDRVEIEKFFNTIEIFISLPKPFAGFNMSWIEAMACNVPKIIGNHNGVGKQLPIIHVEDYNTITEAITESKEKTHYKINPEFNWETQAKTIINLFRRGKDD